MLDAILAELLETQAALADIFIRSQQALSFVAAKGREIRQPEFIVQDEMLSRLLLARYPEGQLRPTLKRCGGIDDFTLTVSGQIFRAALRSTRAGHGLSLSLRRIRPRIPAFEELGLPTDLKELLHVKDGLVLFTGPTGSGKSTSLASLAQRYADTVPGKIVTFEDPIEYRLQDSLAAVDQHEIGADVADFCSGLKGAMRESPTLLVIGEIRDPDTLTAALQGAETGHLVFASLHTNNFAATIDRVCDLLSGGHAEALRKTFAGVLRAVVSQQLLPGLDQRSRVLAHEIVVPTPAIINLIRKGELQMLEHEIDKRLPLLHNLHDTLGSLVREGLVSEQAARAAAYRPESIRI